MATKQIQKLTYTDNSTTPATAVPIQVDSAIRDEDGLKIKANYQKKPQVIEYTVPASVPVYSTRVISEYNGTYDGTPGYIKFYMEVSSRNGTKQYIIESVWGGPLLSRTNIITGTGSVDISELHVYMPSNSSYYSSNAPTFAVYTTSNVERHVKIITFESSGDIVWKTNWDTAWASGTGWVYEQVVLSRNGSTGYAAQASSAGTADTANRASSLESPVLYNGESDSFSLLAVASDGKAYKLKTADKKFMLPIQMKWGRGYSTGDSSGITGGTYSVGVNYLSSSSYNNFTVPTLTSEDNGKTLFIRGSLDSDGYFICDGNVTVEMVAGYTYIPFGVLRYRANSAPISFTVNIFTPKAFTLDSNGKLTHIDGKELAGGGGGTYTLNDVSVAFTLQSTPDYAEFPYCAEVTAPGVTPNSYASVTYSDDQSQSMMYSPVTVTDTGKVKIYARQDVGTVTIPTIAIGIESPVTDDGQPITSPIETRNLTLVSSSDTEYTGFPYKYSFACVGATATRTAQVMFGVEDAQSGNFASECETGAGVIYIWAHSAQSTADIGYMLYYTDDVFVVSGNVGDNTHPIYVLNGQPTAITVPIPVITASTSAPTSGDGSNGDIWLQY